MGTGIGRLAPEARKRTFRRDLTREYRKADIRPARRDTPATQGPVATSATRDCRPNPGTGRFPSDGSAAHEIFGAASTHEGRPSGARQEAAELSFHRGRIRGGFHLSAETVCACPRAGRIRRLPGSVRHLAAGAPTNEVVGGRRVVEGTRPRSALDIRSRPGLEPSRHPPSHATAGGHPALHRGRLGLEQARA
ncbi:hypothetical protein GCM10020219_060960 [Nonomuraea dietziae]